MSEGGRGARRPHGFDRVGLPEPAPPLPGLLAQGVGQASHLISFERLAALKPMTQRVGFQTSQGEQQNEWTGPLLWDVLAASGVADAIKPAEHVRLAVRVNGADGYAAVVALAAIYPHFARRPIQLADH